MAKRGKKFVFVTLDGAADKPSKELQNRTPFEIAYKPNLDWFAENGKTGLMYPIGKGIAPESDTAIMSLLGYDPNEFYAGRGPLEANGAGIPLKIGDLSLRANFATVKKGKLVDSRVGRTLTSSEASLLAKSLNSKVKLGFPFIFKNTVEHRGVLVIRGSFSDNITNAHPYYAHIGKIAVAVRGKNIVPNSKPMDDDEVTQLSANLVNSFVEQSHKVLRNHPLNVSREANNLLPANIVLLRGAGTELIALPKKKEKWMAFSAMPLEISLTKLAGMDVRKFQYPDMLSNNVYKNIYFALKNYIDFVKKQMNEHWGKYDCFYIHIKETDVPGHDGFPLHKKKMIEMIDEMLFSYLRKKGVNLCVTSDHATPCSMKMHSSDPVPVLIYGKGKDKVKRFDEKSCAKGSFGSKMLGKDVLKLAM